MRYIIIPLLIMFYLWWSYKSIKEITKNGWSVKLLTYGYGLEGYALVWTFLHTIIIALGLAWLTIKYW